MFALVQHRDAPGKGYSPLMRGDVVTIVCDQLGSLTNVAVYAESAPPRTFSVGALIRNLAVRGLLGASRSLARVLCYEHRRSKRHAQLYER